MLKTFVVAFAATGLMLSSTAAFARDDTPAPTAASAPKPAADAKTRYCLKTQPLTGTMISSRVCKTLAQWRAEGVDPTKSN